MKNLNFSFLLFLILFLSPLKLTAMKTFKARRISLLLAINLKSLHIKISKHTILYSYFLNLFKEGEHYEDF